MTCETKKIEVDLLYQPLENNFNLLKDNYPEEYEQYRKQAIHCLINPKNTLKPQGKMIAFNTQKTLLNKIHRLNQKYKDATPERKKKITFYIERGEIAKKAKQLANYNCLICEGIGKETLTFKKKNSNNFYIETHHIDYVSSLKKGSLAFDNLITVCSHHHRQFHYGDLEVISSDDNFFTFKIDNCIYKTKKLKLNQQSNNN